VERGEVWFVDVKLGGRRWSGPGWPFGPDPGIGLHRPHGVQSGSEQTADHRGILVWASGPRLGDS